MPLKIILSNYRYKIYPISGAYYEYEACFMTYCNYETMTNLVTQGLLEKPLTFPLKSK